MKTLITAVVFSAIASAGFAQDNCGRIDRIVTNLVMKYDEHLRAVMPVDGERVVFLFTAPNGTWTLVEGRPDGVGCILGFGEDYGEHERTPTGEDA